MDYNVIIAGGSFAGLAAALQLRGNHVLMVEPHTIGAVQTSACGTLLSVLNATNTMDSLLQVHDHILIHLRKQAFKYHLPYPFCTFDYQTFCSLLLAQTDVELLHASVLGHRGHIVYTTKGEFDAELLIDATGCRAALSTNTRQRAEPHSGKSFGLETVIPITEEDLHFYFDPDKMGAYHVGWLFPVGVKSRAGFASYQGDTHLSQGLRKFIGDRFEYAPNGVHGGYFPHKRQEAVTGNIFRVGDAAGQCFPLSGEGIRPALFFGMVAGYLAKLVLEGELREKEALQAYRKLNHKLDGAYTLSLAAQKILPALPLPWLERLAGFMQPSERIGPLMLKYRKLFEPLPHISDEESLRNILHQMLHHRLKSRKAYSNIG